MSAVVRLTGVALNRGVERSEGRHAGAAGKHSLPDVSQFTHSKDSGFRVSSFEFQVRS
jgi:hypothetical protein